MASEARQRLSGLLTEVYAQQARVIIERGGIPVAAVVSPDDLARLERAEAEQEARLKVLARMREPFKDVPAEEIEREVARAISEVRRENRQEASPSATRVNPPYLETRDMASGTPAAEDADAPKHKGEATGEDKTQ